MSTDSPALPRIGARIRVTRSCGDIVETVEGRVTATPDDGRRVAVLGGSYRVALADDADWTVAWAELEPPKPALPEEPAFYEVVGNDWTKVPHELFLRVPVTDESDGAEYWDMLNGSLFGRRTWEQVVKLVPDPVRWLPAPDLAELVEAFGVLIDETCSHWSYRRAMVPRGEPPQDVSRDECESVECRQRQALLAKFPAVQS